MLSHRIVAIVGRPNVGKSTLFNRLTRSRDAIVADVPGIRATATTAAGASGSKPYLVVDTGGFEPVGAEGIYHEMARQTRQAVDEADAVLFIVDARAGLTPQDRAIADELRKTGRTAFLVVNKAEGMAPDDGGRGVSRAGPGRSAGRLGGARRERERPDGARARGVSRATDEARTQRRASIRDRGRRPAQRRQVDAGQRAARRGARHRVRPARHDARFDLRRVRARRAGATR